MMGKRIAVVVLSLLLLVGFAIPIGAIKGEIDLTPTDLSALGELPSIHDLAPERTAPPSEIDENGEVVINGVTVDTKGKELLGKGEKKLDSQLLKLVGDRFLPEGTSRAQVLALMEAQGQIKKKNAETKNEVTGVRVYVRLNEGFGIDAIEPFVMEITRSDKKNLLAAVVVDADRIAELAAQDAVRSVRVITRPVVNGAKVDTTEGDEILNADDLRSKYGVTGAGIKIGVISNGVDHLGDAVATGDLPSGITVLSNDFSEGGDEGTAMLEIVYDLAPGASLYFHDHGEDILDFNDAITALVNAGCDVIVDDVSWLGEPYFSDGDIATHVKNILESEDIIYVTSAGNHAQQHYQGTYYNYRDGTDGYGDAVNVHDFSRGTSSDKSLYVVLPPYTKVLVILQWNEYFGSATYDYSDYDLYMFDYTYGNRLAYSWEFQSETHEPFEAIEYYNENPYTVIGEIMVRRWDAPTPKTLELFIFGAGGAYPTIDNLKTADSIWGHAAVPEVIACGAVDWYTPSTLEYFSSRGPVTHISGTRNKPDVVATDGVNVTGVGDFSDPFYGTSASAPHVAAIAALLMERYPTLNADAIRSVLVGNTVDLGATGFDSLYGYGRVDALRAADSRYYVDFDSQGGSAVTSALVLRNGLLAAPAAPTRSGFVFNGWFKQSECTTPWNFASDRVNAETTLYAKWSYGVTLTSSNTSYGTVAGGGLYQPGTTVTVTATPKPGYCFTGWTEGESNTSPDPSYTFTAERNIALRANFIPIATPTATATLETYASVRVNWSSVPYAYGYEIARATSSSGTYTIIDSTSSSNTSFTDIVSTSGVTYYYKVRAFCMADAIRTSSSYSAYASAKPQWPAMTLTAALANYHDASLSWTSVANVDGYALYRSTSSSSGYTEIATDLTGTNYIDIGLPVGRTYYYKVRPFILFYTTKVYGPYTSYRSVTPSWPSITLTASTLDYRSVNLAWTNVPDVDGYEVSRMLTSTGTPVMTKFVEDHFYIDSDGLTLNRVYYYKVRAYDVIGDNKVFGPYCTYKSAKAAWPSITLTARTQTYNSIRLTWNTIAGADGYEVQRSLTTSSTSFLPVTEVTTGEYNDEGLDTNKTYYYKVRPFDEIDGGKVYGPFCTYKYARTAWPALSLTARTRSYTSISLSWNKIAGADAYEIERSLSSSALTFTPLAEVGDVTSYIDYACESGKTYYYRVRGVDYIGLGDKVKGPFCTVRYAKAAWPTLTLTAVAQNHRSIQLNWNALDGITGYEVWRNTAATGTFTHIATVEGAPGLLDDGSDGLDVNRTYYYKIRAYNGADVGAFSSVKYARTAWKAFTVTAVSTGFDSIRISWNEISRAQGYNVYRCDTSGGVYVKLNTEDVMSTYYDDEGLTTGKTYYYKVEAFDTVRSVRIFSPRSAYKSAKPLPLAPTGLLLENMSTTSISLNWNAVEGATGYEVYRATSLSGTYTRIATTAETTALSSGLTTGRTYYYKVRAYTRVGTTNYFGPYCAVQSKRAELIPL